MCVLEHKEEARHVLKECLSNESVIFSPLTECLITPSILS